MTIGIDLSKNTIDMILYLFDKEKVTKECSPLGKLSYYAVIWYLRDIKFVFEDGVNENNQKIWKLSPLGRRIAFNLSEIRRELNYGREKTNNDESEGNEGQSLDS
jgi:hypothetical protein